MSYQDVKNYRIRLKERAIYVMGDKCQCCGYDKTNTALEFHHIDASQKSFTISQNTNHSWNDVKEEIKKCVLVCANCHREIHCGLINNNNLQSSFIEERANEIDNMVNAIKNKSIFYCIECGCEVYRGNKYCPQCAAMNRRTVERPTREKLKELIRTTSFTQIAKQFGVSDNTIRKWCKSMLLPSKVSEIKQYSDEDWELL